ncbi:MAG: type II secretion system F family protein [Alphaproteobacteria bacterium]
MKLSFLKRKKYNAEKLYGKDKNIIILLIISGISSAILFLIGLLIMAGAAEFKGNILSGLDFMVFGLIAVIGPVGFYINQKENKKRLVEKHLPDFLREISSATSSGMTVFDAIANASKGDYGKLGPELQKMASQLSWGISVNEALENFAKRINTPSVKRIVVTINKALEIGGNTADVFEAAAKEIDQVKLVEQQRKAEMSMYSIVIFISFFVFLAVILIIDKTIFAEFFKLQEQMSNMGTGSGGIPGMSSGGNIDPKALKDTFFVFVLVQSVGGGLLGGFMMDGKLSSGVRYGFLLILVTFFTFKLFF